MTDKAIAKLGKILAENIELSFKRKDIVNVSDITEDTRLIIEKAIMTSLDELTKDDLRDILVEMITSPILSMDLLERSLERNKSEPSSKS